MSNNSKVPSPLQVCVGTYTLVLVYFSFKLINLFISISSSHQKSTHNVACSLFLPIDGPSGGFQGSGPLALGLTMISPKRREQRVVWDLWVNTSRVPTFCEKFRDLGSYKGIRKCPVPPPRPGLPRLLSCWYVLLSKRAHSLTTLLPSAGGDREPRPCLKWRPILAQLLIWNSLSDVLLVYSLFCCSVPEVQGGRKSPGLLARGLASSSSFAAICVAFGMLFLFLSCSFFLYNTGPYFFSWFPQGPEERTCPKRWERVRGSQ